MKAKLDAHLETLHSLPADLAEFLENHVRIESLRRSLLQPDGQPLSYIDAARFLFENEKARARAGFGDMTRVVRSRGASKSEARLKVESLIDAAPGAYVDFPYGTFVSPEAVMSLVNRVGGKGRLEATSTPSGYRVTRV